MQQKQDWVHKDLYSLIESNKYNRRKSIKKKHVERPFNRKIHQNVFWTEKGWRNKINLKSKEQIVEEYNICNSLSRNQVTSYLLISALEKPD